jgi:large subunit ribosomal protein L9
LHAKIVEAGVELDKKKVHLYTPVKTLGNHTSKIKLHAEVSVELSFDVVSENPIEETESEEAAESES